MSPRRLVVMTLVVCGSAWAACLQAGEDKPRPADAIQIGMVSSLFRDTSKPLAAAILEPFAVLVRGQTGLNTRVARGGEALELGRQLNAGEFQIAIFQGVEFAWARQKYDQLRPLMIIVNVGRQRFGDLVVRADSKAACFADLKGCSLAMPLQGRAHCYLFLERGCRDAGQADPARFFSSISAAPTAEDALDDIVDDSVAASIVDKLAFEAYRQRKPARAARLKVIQQSEPFPPTIVAYRPGSLDQQKVQQFQEGLLRANHMPLARTLLTLWRMTAFEPVPDDLEEMLANILKAYPSPKE